MRLALNRPENWALIGLPRFDTLLTCVYKCVMRKVNALKLRQEFGRVLEDLDKTGEPILLEKGRQPRAVIISLKDFQERFVDKVASQERRHLVERIKSLSSRFRMPQEKGALSSQDIIRELRGPLGV